MTLTAGSDQVRRYLANYGVVLATNYRDFELLGLDSRSHPPCCYFERVGLEKSSTV